MKLGNLRETMYQQSEINSNKKILIGIRSKDTKKNKSSLDLHEKTNKQPAKRTNEGVSKELSFYHRKQ